MHGCRWRCSTRRSASSPRSRPGQHARPTTFRCTTWGAILPPRHPPRLVRAPSIRGRRRTSRAFGLCRSEARDGGIARQPGLGSKPDRRVHRAVPMVAAPLDNLEEKASLLGPRIDLEELAAAIAIVENISCAQPVNLRHSTNIATQGDVFGDISAALRGVVKNPDELHQLLSSVDEMK